MSHDPSELILMCWFAAQETFLIIISVESSKEQKKEPFNIIKSEIYCIQKKFSFHCRSQGKLITNNETLQYFRHIHLSVGQSQIRQMSEWTGCDTLVLKNHQQNYREKGDIKNGFTMRINSWCALCCELLALLLIALNPISMFMQSNGWVFLIFSRLI